MEPNASRKVTTVPVSKQHDNQQYGSAASDPGPSTRFRWQLGLLVALAFAIPAELYLAIPIVGRIQLAFHTDQHAASWTGSAFGLAYAVGFLVFGPLSDRVGRRPVLVLGALGMALTTALVTACPTLGWFIAARAAQGLAASTFAPVALAYVAERSPAPFRTLALSLLTTGLLGAGIVGQVYGQLVAGHAPWQAAFWPAAVCYAAAVPLLFLLLDRGRRTTSAPLRVAYVSMAGLVRVRATAVVFLSALTVFGSFVGMYVVAELHLRTADGFDTNGLLVVEALGGLGLAVAPVVSHFAGSSTPRHLAVAGFLLAATGLLVEQAGSVVAVILGSVVFVGGISVVVPSLVGVLSGLVPDARGTAVAVNTFALFAGASIAQQLAVRLGFHTMLTVLTAALVLGAVAVGTLATTGRGRVAVTGHLPATRSTRETTTSTR